MGKRAKTLTVDGATPGTMPAFIKPQLATLRSKAPKGSQWLHEIKYDGYRVQVHLNKGKKKVFTRNGLDWTKRFVSKNGDAPYRSERNEAWFKIKTVQKEKFPIIGFVKDPTGVAALYLGRREGEDLVYMGKVGTGWSRTVSSQIRKQLDTVVSPKSKLTKPIKKPKATWVEPLFTAEVEFRDITSEGLLRQSSFKGLSKGTRRR